MNYAIKHIWPLSKEAFSRSSKDRAPMLGAALSYYTVFSLAPLLLLAISIAGLILGPQAARGELFGQLKGLLGTDGANTIQTMVSHANKQSTGIISTIIGFLTLLLGASGVFGQMKEALNSIWKVTKKPKVGLWNLIRERFLNFSMVGVIGFLLLVSLIASSVISTLASYVGGILPFNEVFLEISNFIISFFLVSALFAMIYRVLPDVQLPWKIAWIGAFVASLLFTIGKTVIGLYIGHSAIASSYGAAASLIIILLWAYYTAQILLFGAEFTKAYVLNRNIEISPSETAEFTDQPDYKENAAKFLGIRSSHDMQTLTTYFLSGLVIELLSRVIGKGKKK